MKTVWLFYWEDEEDGENSFTVVASDHEEAYEIALESYGPQVNDMYYRELSKKV